MCFESWHFSVSLFWSPGCPSTSCSISPCHNMPASDPRQSQETEAIHSPNVPQLHVPRLQQLPRELRDEIYSSYFGSIRLSQGKRQISPKTCILVKTMPHALSLLRTCRQIYQETRLLWVSLVLFVFEDGESFFKTLASLSSEIIARIRHIRSSGYRTRVGYKYNEFCDALYPSPYLFEGSFTNFEVIHTFPQLRLDSLTILELDPEGPYVSFHAFQLLLQNQRWKTLIYISKDPGHIHRIELHSCAKKFLQTEEATSDEFFHSEGLGSKAFFQMKSLSTGASFQVFRATSTSALSGIIDPRNRECYPKNKRRREKGIMIVAKRGNATKAAKNQFNHGETRTVANRDVDMDHIEKDSCNISEYLARISQYKANCYLTTVGEMVDVYRSRDDMVGF
jgi:hypothetical protein